MKKLTIDFETRSAAPIRKVGAARYAEDLTTEVICLALKWQGEEPVIWYSPAFRGGLTLPTVSDDTVRSMIKTADVIEAHNAQFEYFIWKYVMPRYGFAMFDVKKLRCSAAKAATYGLPRSLEQACQVMKVRQQKDMEGSRLMMSLCRPRKALKAEMLADPSWESKLYWRGTPADFTRLGIYCMQDVRAEEDFSDSLPDLPEAEQRLWQLDLAINDRGVHVDAPATTAIVRCLETHSCALIRKFGQLTGGQVSSPRQREATLRHLIALGVQMDGLTANDVEAALASTENETARQILKIRQSLSKASTAKYKAFLEARNSDDRLRGMFMYHGAGTGRWTGKIVQPQNFPRGSFSDVDGAIRLFQAGDLEAIDLFYADPMVAAATCIRGMITPAEGHDFICADYSAIEGRVLAWLAGEEDALNVYREGRDPYKVAAAAIYHTTADAVDKSQRQVGKVAELACIAEGSLVLTDAGLVPIEEVQPYHRLWDGFEFVAHGGVVCRGRKEVIRYAGLCATPDHLVWVKGKSGPVPFGNAAASSAHLVQTGAGGKAVRVGKGYIAGKTMECEMEHLLRAYPMCELRPGGMVQFGCAHQREVERVSALFPTQTDTEMVGEATGRGEATVREPGRSGLSFLWKAWDYLRLPFSALRWAVDYEKSVRCQARRGDRPNRQQPGVCSGKHPFCYACREPEEQTQYEASVLGPGGVAVCPICGCSQDCSRDDTLGDYRRGPKSCKRKAKKLEGNRHQALVYDILNAGPRHRFTVSGVLVHNCGYQGGVNAFNRMAENYGVELPESEVKSIVEKWRANRPETVRYWAELERACFAAVSKPGAVYKYRNVKFTVRNGFLAVKLPSGRCLYYANPRIEQKEMSWGGMKAVVSYEGVNSMTRKWVRSYLYGGLLAENITQATARDVLVNGLFQAETHDYPVVLHVHDEAVAEVPETAGSVEEFEKLLCTTPVWAAELPLEAEGWRGKRYKK